MNREYSKDWIIDSLKELADKDYQRTVWLASSGPEVSSFDEAISRLFNDSGLDRLLEKQTAPVLSIEIDESLRKLRRLVIEASFLFRSISFASIIEHPKMDEIRQSATEILARMTQD